MDMNASAYNDDELLAVLMSREVRDGEISACGAHAQIPAAALLLAQSTHAPAAELIILGTPLKVFHTSRQFHFLAQRGDLGLFFVSGVQIDRHGNYNLHQLGRDLDRPETRFPGGYGGGMIYYCARRTIVYRTEHTRRSLVERVDYISAAGSTPPEALRRGHPSKLFTPKAVFGFDQAAGLLRLESIHGRYTEDDVRANTGWDLGIQGPVPATVAPSGEELRVLREVVRPKMMETGVYADWARTRLQESPLSAR